MIPKIRRARQRCEAIQTRIALTIARQRRLEHSFNAHAQLPYVVKLSPPFGRLIAAPVDHPSVIRAEVCFGQRKESLLLTLACLPEIKQQTQPKLRFCIGDRVACALEDATNDCSLWGAGTVVDINYSVKKASEAVYPDRKWKGNPSLIPYRVNLDTGCKVLVQRDEEWLVRALELQAEVSPVTRTRERESAWSRSCTRKRTCTHAQGPRHEEHDDREIIHEWSCGHDHGHGHDGCCGHDHGHEDNGHGGYGHDHGHGHDGCCGHEHGHDKYEHHEHGHHDHIH